AEAQEQAGIAAAAALEGAARTEVGLEPEQVEACTQDDGAVAVVHAQVGHRVGHARQALQARGGLPGLVLELAVPGGARVRGEAAGDIAMMPVQAAYLRVWRLVLQ